MATIEVEAGTLDRLRAGGKDQSPGQRRRLPEADREDHPIL